MTVPGPGPGDLGLQPERTRLAWRRTTLAGAVAALLAGRSALHGGVSPAGLVGAGLGALAWLALLGVAQRRIRCLDDDTTPCPLRPRVAVAATVCVITLAAFGAAVLL